MYRNDDQRTDHDLCPRCVERYLPATYPGALSRADNATEICSTCGTDEALSNFASPNTTLPGPADWPVKVRADGFDQINQVTRVQR
jgi:hypothetical protein